MLSEDVLKLKLDVRNRLSMSPKSSLEVPLVRQKMNGLLLTMVYVISMVKLQMKKRNYCTICCHKLTDNALQCTASTIPNQMCLVLFVCLARQWYHTRPVNVATQHPLQFLQFQ